ncbi:MAG: hypothetical protein HJJLKODD_01967 [Phycisphaerae bacterium]|nr:hypothetical protein [Phycisphaerae bacterium]
MRHQHPASLLLHVLGIPMTIVAGILVIWQLADWRWDLWWRPALWFTLGYVLQYIGHRIEGNTMGELILLYRRLGRPYTAIAPRYQPPPAHDPLSTEQNTSSER